MDLVAAFTRRSWSFMDVLLILVQDKGPGVNLISVSVMFPALKMLQRSFKCSSTLRISPSLLYDFLVSDQTVTMVPF